MFPSGPETLFRECGAKAWGERVAFPEAALQPAPRKGESVWETPWPRGSLQGGQRALDAAVGTRGDSPLDNTLTFQEG